MRHYPDNAGRHLQVGRERSILNHDFKDATFQEGSAGMTHPIFAITIHEKNEAFVPLKAALADLSVESHEARGSDDGKDLVGQYQPLLLFVDLETWRRSREEILELETYTDLSFSSIVVGSSPDIETFAEVVGQGAFEYIAPPFSRETLTRVVQSAAMDAQYRRESLAKVPQPYGIA